MGLLILFEGSSMLQFQIGRFKIVLCLLDNTVSLLIKLEHRVSATVMENAKTDCCKAERN